MLDKMRTLLTTAVLLSIPAPQPPTPCEALTQVSMTVTVIKDLDLG